MTENLSPLSVHQRGAGRILLRCFSYLRPYWRWSAPAYLALLVIDALNMLIPQLIRWIVDRGIGDQDVRLLSWSVLTLLGLTLLKGGLTFFQGRWIEMSSQGVAYDLRNATWMNLIADALMVYVAPDGRIIRVVGEPDLNTGETIDVVMEEGPLKAAMVQYGLDILGLSILISIITATLVFLALAFAMRPFLGPRDWDLFAFFAPPLGLWVVLRLLVRMKDRELRPVAAIALGMGVFFLFPWIVGNATLSVAGDRAVRLSWRDRLPDISLTALIFPRSPSVRGQATCSHSWQVLLEQGRLQPVLTW